MSKADMEPDASTCRAGETSLLVAEEGGSVKPGEDQGEVDEEVDVPNEDIEEDLFGMTVVSLIRDIYYISVGKGRRRNRIARISTTSGLLAMCIFIQVFLLLKVQEFVTSKAVHDVRIAYDEFEGHMYSLHTLTANGKKRGVDGTFDPEKFATLSADAQSQACRIPLSQPDFFFCVLFIWTITCMGEVKRCARLWRTLVWETDSCTSMAGAMYEGEESDGHEFVCAALPAYMKVLISVFVVLPRMFITSFLLWLGCRWLLATNNFADLILNAVALEFVLVIKELMYTSLVPNRNKQDLAATKIRPKIQRQKASIDAFTRTLFWGVFAAIWVIAYMGIPHTVDGLQVVLPEYKWDVHQVCKPWITWRYCVDPPCPSGPLALPGGESPIGKKGRRGAAVDFPN